MLYLILILIAMLITNIALLGYIPLINVAICQPCSIAIIVIVLIVLVVIYEKKLKTKKFSSHVLSNVNSHMEALLFATCILFLSIGIFVMMVFNGDSDKVTNVFSGLSVIAFGITLWTILTSFQEKNKENKLHNNTTIPQKLIKDNIKLSNKLSNLEKENKVLHDEINDIKQQNEEIIKLLKEINNKDTCVINKMIKKLRNRRKE